MSKRGWAWTMIAALAVALFCLVYPVYVIRPFRAQGVRELAVALAVLQWRPWALVGCIVLGALSLRAGRIWPKAAYVLICVSALLSRVNIYERMFHPMGPPAFASIAETKLDADEKVVAVKVGEVARAYPVRSISYHHIVNDTAGGQPIVATY
jgi:hypothetical protein